MALRAQDIVWIKSDKGLINSRIGEAFAASKGKKGRRARRGRRGILLSYSLYTPGFRLG
jgi:hypothetical protein